MLDINEFYPSVSTELLPDALTYADTIINRYFSIKNKRG